MPDPILERFPYPWHEPEAVALHEALCQIYPTARGAQYVAERAEVPLFRFNLDQPAFEIWREILRETSNASRTRALVELVRDQNPRHPLRPVLDDVLAARPTPLSPEPRAPDGSPVFISGSDAIGEPEALLHRDDLTLSTGRLPALIEALRKLLALSAAVCRLEVNFGGACRYGTGFRIAPDLLLTNWHVLAHEGAVPTAVTAEVGYEEDASGNGLSARAVPCAVASIVSNQDDDWGVIRAAGPLPDDMPIVPLATAAAPVIGSLAFVIQHPGGRRKRIGYVRNTIASFDDRVLHYLTDTEQGSSGSPVFDEDGRLIGLHHRGGRPQEVLGKPPMRMNEGIRIPRVQAGLAKAGIAVP